MVGEVGLGEVDLVSHWDMRVRVDGEVGWNVGFCLKGG